MNQPAPLDHAAVAALVTPPGRSAIAVLRVQGAGAAATVARYLKRSSGARVTLDRPRVVLAHWGAAAGEPVVVRVRGADEVEIHCHGGAVSPQAIMSDLNRSGVALISWRDLVRREAAGNIEAEAVLALSEASTLRAAGVLMDQLHGALRGALRTIQDRIHHGAEEVGESAATLARLIDRAALGVHLVAPWRVAIGGRQNVGKSTLLNALVGFERAIVDERAGTTRDIVTARGAVDGWPVEFLDTAGIRPATDELEKLGMDRAESALGDSDCQLVVLDRSRARTSADETILAACPHPIVVANKSDLPPARDGWPGGRLPVLVSGRTGGGIRELLSRLAAALVPCTPAPGAAVPFTGRQVERLRAAHASLMAGRRYEALRELGELLGGE